MNIKARKGYRPNVAMIVINNDNRVLICRRRNTQTWQFPQGGIDPNENIQEAMYRELHEEVGLSKEDVNIIGKSKKMITYDIPITLRLKVLGGKFKGQDQKWFLLKTIKDDIKINLNNEVIPEFEEFEWVSYWRALDRIIDFKKEAYRQALTELRFFV